MAGMEQPFERAADAAQREPLPSEGTLPAPPQELPQVGAHGWLLPTLLQTDTALTGRWDYLAECWQRGELLDAPIPRLDFLSSPDRAVWKMLTTSLDAIPNYGHGGWAGWSGPDYFRFFRARTSPSRSALAPLFLSS